MLLVFPSSTLALQYLRKLSIFTNSLLVKRSEAIKCKYESQHILHIVFYDISYD